MNSYVKPKPGEPLSDYYPLFLPRLMHSFRTICGSEHIAALGYPMQGYTVLRNVFDQLVLTSAAAQGVVDFYSIEGVKPGVKLDLGEAKQLRKDSEFAVFKKFIGTESGLTEEARDDLRVLDALFDYETHGARVSLADDMPWMKGEEPLRVLPSFKEKRMANFFNRANECQWMLHRLLPLAQAPGVPFPPGWQSKWCLIDESFEYLVRGLTVDVGKRIGVSFVEFVTKKFPFNEKSVLPGS